MSERNIYVTRPSLPSLQEYMHELESVWDSCIVTNMGTKHEQLEVSLKEFLGVGRAVLFSNGHLALEAAIQSFGLHDEVITTPFTFVSTTHALVRSGITPVMCDVLRQDGTIDPASVRRSITKRTTGILAVHVYGNPCCVEQLEEIAKEYNLKLIYDAAHAFGARLGNQSLVSFGDASVLSFHATKVFNTVEGGAVCLPANASMEHKLELWRNFGIEDEECVSAVGGNAKMDELRAAMGLCNLRRFRDDVAARKRIHERYKQRLEHIEGVRFVCSNREDLDPNYAYEPICICASSGVSRNEVFDALMQEGVVARKYFYPCVNTCACYSKTMDPSQTPTAIALSEEVLSLPIYPSLSLEDVDRIAAIVARTVGGVA